MKSYSPKLVTSYRLAKFPCLECPDRKQRCHSVCEKYKAAKEKNEENRANTLKARKTDYDVNSSMITSMVRRGVKFGRS